jgi:hypothetical protein
MQKRMDYWHVNCFFYYVIARGGEPHNEEKHMDFEIDSEADAAVKLHEEVRRMQLERLAALKTEEEQKHGAMDLLDDMVRYFQNLGHVSPFQRRDEAKHG